MVTIETGPEFGHSIYIYEYICFGTKSLDQYFEIAIIILITIYRSFLYIKHDVSETEFCLRFQV
jgi:hypothetical protein